MDSEQQMDPSDSEFNNDDHNDQPESSSQSDDRNAQHLPDSDLPFTDPVPEMSSVETEGEKDNEGSTVVIPQSGKPVYHTIPKNRQI